MGSAFSNRANCVIGFPGGPVLDRPKGIVIGIPKSQEARTAHFPAQDEL